MLISVESILFSARLFPFSYTEDKRVTVVVRGKAGSIDCIES